MWEWGLKRLLCPCSQSKIIRLNSAEMCVCVCLPIKRLQIWRQPWLLLFALFIKRRWADGLLVCCAVHTCGHTHTHMQIRKRTWTQACHLSFILHLSFPLHISQQDNATQWIVRCVCVCVWEEPKSFSVKTEVVIWKADDSFTRWFLWMVAIHLSTALFR